MNPRRGDRVVALRDWSANVLELPVVKGRSYRVAETAGVRKGRVAIVLLDGDHPLRWLPARDFAVEGRAEARPAGGAAAAADLAS